MQRIATATRELDKFGAGKDGFKNGAPGVAATQFSAEWCDQVQEEIAGVIEGYGAALDAANKHQLLGVIQAAIAAVAGGLPAASNAEAAALSIITKSITPGTLKYVFLNAATVNTTGYQKLPSGLIIQWGRYGFGSALASNTNTTITLPITYTTAHCAAFASRYGVANTTTPASIFVNNDTLGSITVYNASASDANLFWFSIGY